MGMRITKADDYAIRAMIHLACLPEGTVAMRHDIARAQGIPSSFMAKILGSLVRARLLHSSRGVRGGFGLDRKADEITLLDVLEAVEGPLRLAECTSPSENCSWSPECPAASIWARVQSAVREILSSTTLEDLVSMPRRNGRVIDASPSAEMPSAETSSAAVPTSAETASDDELSPKEQRERGATRRVLRVMPRFEVLRAEK